MSDWADAELASIGGADELQISSRRDDGSLRPFVTVWVVRVGGDLYIRSAHGSANPWFRRAKASGTGRIRAGGVDRDVSFQVVPTDAAVHTAIDAAYHSKYDQYGSRFVDPVVGEHVRDVTFRLLPA
jgi:hypothetical protein